MSDVVDLIIQDHRELQRLFSLLQDEPERRPAMAPVMSTLLFAHSRAEEAEVYPAARDAGAREDVEHSQKEHLAADELAEKLQRTDPTSAEFGRVLDDLVEAVTHHLEEEEETVLPDMRRLMSAEQLVELGERFLAVREQHLGDQPEDRTRDQMLQQARNADVDHVSGQGKEALRETLSDEADL